MATSTNHISVLRLPARLRALRAKMILGVDRIVSDLDKVEHARPREFRGVIYSDGRVEVTLLSQYPTITDADVPSANDN